jgi:uncharacterized integral membrane protein
MRQLRWFVAVVLLLGTLIGLALFVTGNRSPVRVALPFLQPFYQEAWLALLGAFIAGAFTASAGLLFQLARKSLAARRLEKRARSLEAELAELRAAGPAIAAGDGAPPLRPAP